MLGQEVCSFRNQTKSKSEGFYTCLRTNTKYARIVGRSLCSLLVSRSSIIRRDLKTSPSAAGNAGCSAEIPATARTERCLTPHALNAELRPKFPLSRWKTGLCTACSASRNKGRQLYNRLPTGHHARFIFSLIYGYSPPSCIQLKYRQYTGENNRPIVQ